MAKLWMTYAWKDNEDEDVDHIIAEIRAKGIEVGYDRVQLLAGHLIWEQIAAAINSDEVTAWAIYISENSLRSRPCREELAYALDRALSSKGDDFSLVGLFNGDFDRDLMPAPLAVRLGINLLNNDWADQLVTAIKGEKHAQRSAPRPFGFKFHYEASETTLEIWPRTGAWSPFQLVVNIEDKDAIGFVMRGARGAVPMSSAISGLQKFDTPEYYVTQFDSRIDAVTSCFVNLKRIPKIVMFGCPTGMYKWSAPKFL